MLLKDREENCPCPFSGACVGLCLCTNRVQEKQVKTGMVFFVASGTYLVLYSGRKRHFEIPI